METEKIVKMRPDFIKIQDNNTVAYGWTTFTQKDGNMFSCYIPSFNIYFSSPTQEEIKITGRAMTTTFIRFWIKKQGLRKFMLHIHKLGFRAPGHDAIMFDLLHNRRHPAKFKTTKNYDTPIGAERIENEETVMA